MNNKCINISFTIKVNVFLGIGIAWTMAAVVHWFKGTVFLVDPGSVSPVILQDLKFNLFSAPWPFLSQFSALRPSFVLFALLPVGIRMSSPLPLHPSFYYYHCSSVGGELGGPRKFQIITSGFFGSLWLFYIGISALESYCVIAGF
jgi:solute carrier family 8 (sodium/calcium exchanger)